MIKRNLKNSIFAWSLIFPQLLITFVFFIWPALDALCQSLYKVDPFGIDKVFIGSGNFSRLFSSYSYRQTIVITLVFSALVTTITLLSHRIAKAANSEFKVVWQALDQIYRTGFCQIQRRPSKDCRILVPSRKLISRRVP